MQAVTKDPKADSAWRSPWVIGWIVMVTLVFGVNAFMVYKAFTTSSGLVNQDPYDRGMEYERHLIARMMRDPGWTIHPDVPLDIKPDVPTAIRASLVDKSGQPVSAERVTFYAYRPSDSKRDFAATMKEETKGHYVVEVSFPLYGFWDGIVAVQEGQDEHTAGMRVVVLKP
jgi:nitrogen fixation protein FixH